MTGVNRDTKVINNQNITHIKRTINLEAFHKISAKLRDFVGEVLVAGR
jgi:hypothetical protein